jgi:diguanylate cyclase (GGDEF)-like protein
MEAEIPQDEAKRLEALRSLGILDTPPEERFDRLTRLAKRLFGVPVASVSLVDSNREWFKSCIGLDVKELPRDISFCGHAILGDHTLIIPNALEDPRFADNPLVNDETHVRFYAGHPLKAPDGSKLGTLCIVDYEPRYFEPEDFQALADLAAIVEREFSMMQLATKDDLTGILNRRGFMMLTRHSLSLSARDNVTYSLAFLDLDHFKSVNDQFGHLEGDRALVTFAQVMERELRDSDIVARLGGDEFAVLLNHSSKADGEALMERLQSSITAINQQENRGYALAFSFGIVEFDSKKHESIECLLAECDALMYEVKKSKR